jgi:hypothetical protein
MIVLAVLIALLGAGPVAFDMSGSGPPGYVATDGSDALSGNGPPG